METTIDTNYTKWEAVPCYYSDLAPGVQVTIVLYWCMAIVTFVTACVLVRMTFVVLERLQGSDYVIPGMLTCLMLSCVSAVLFFSFQIYATSFQYIETVVMVAPVYYPMPPYECSIYVSSQLPQLFLCVAVLLNINKWIQFTMRINFLAFQNNMEAEFNGHDVDLRKLKMDKARRFFNILTGSVITIWFLFNISYYTITCSYPFETDEDWSAYAADVTSWVTVGMFTILSIIFFITGVRMIHALQTHFPKFIAEFKSLMWLTVILITIPLTFRAMFDCIKKVDAINAYLSSGSLKNGIYNFVFFLLTTYLPILFQITTLVFGFVRGKQTKKIQQQIFLDQNGNDTASNLSHSDNTGFDVSGIHDEHGTFFDPPIENYCINQSEDVMYGGLQDITRESSGGLVIKKSLINEKTVPPPTHAPRGENGKLQEGLTSSVITLNTDTTGLKDSSRRGSQTLTNSQRLSLYDQSKRNTINSTDHDYNNKDDYHELHSNDEQEHKKWYDDDHNDY